MVDSELSDGWEVLQSDLRYLVKVFFVNRMHEQVISLEAQLIMVDKASYCTTTSRG